MYCNKCGKQIDSGVMCTDCLISELATSMAKEAPVKNEPEKATEQPTYQWRSAPEGQDILPTER